MQQLKFALEEKEHDENQNFLLSLSALKTNEHSLCKCTKNYLQPTKRIPPIKYPNGSWAQTNEQKANILADHLATVFKLFASQDLHDKEVTDFLNAAEKLD